VRLTSSSIKILVGAPGHVACMSLVSKRTKAAIAEQRKFSGLLKMLRAGLT